MKKWLSLLLAAALLVSCASALAETTTIDGTENRHIKVNPAGDNTVEEGVSPTTGLTLSDYDLPVGYSGLAVTGEYKPILVQIDNTYGGISGTMTNDSGEEFTAVYAPWGLSYCDVLYETPLYSYGATRISGLFADVLPTDVGPVRSARVGHAWLREEWGAGFVFWGAQKYARTNVELIFTATGVSKQKYFIFSGTNGGKAWNQYMTRHKGTGYKAPSNATADLAGLSTLLPEGYEYPNHAFLFTDDIPEGDPAYTVNVYWGTYYDSMYEYDADSNAYYRYMVYPDGQIAPYEDRETQSQFAFNNLIIQWTDVEWSRSDAPVAKYLPGDVVKDIMNGSITGKKVNGANKFYSYTGGGEGNADYFMGGTHSTGYWVHDTYNTRTVFYDADGNEKALQRGKTMIITLPLENKLTYED